MIFVHRQSKTRLNREEWGFVYKEGKLILERYLQEHRQTRAWPWSVTRAYSRYNTEGYSKEVLTFEEQEVPLPHSVVVIARKRFADSLTVCKANPFRPGDALRKEV